jgi:hypothetical protein
LIWIATVINSFVCVRRLGSTLKWAGFNAAYLLSPFVYLLYYPLVRATGVNAYDVLGTSLYWLGLGLLITYTWWLLVTAGLLWFSSLEKAEKAELTWSLFLAPAYYFMLLIVARTLGIVKYLSTWLGRLAHSD